MRGALLEPHPYLTIAKMKGDLLFVLTIAIYCKAQQPYVIQPEKNAGEDKIIVQAYPNDTVEIYCKISNVTSTTWEVDGISLDFNVISGASVTANYTYFSVFEDLTFESNLTILPHFMAEHDRLEVICRDGNINDPNREVFLFGIPAAPVLYNDSISVYDVEEGTQFTLDVSKTSDPFPPYIKSIWTLNGMELTQNYSDLLNIVTGDYSITISSVSRDSAGVLFKVNVSNAIGYDYKTFSLNVQYPPSAGLIFSDENVFGEINGSAQLRAVSSLDGNPFPNITWLEPSDDPIEFPHNRFESKIDGILIITQIQKSDFNGSFLFAAVNEFGTLIVEVTLLEAIKPGKPQNINIIEIGSDFVEFTWMAPDILGNPNLTHYNIRLSPMEVITTNTTFYIEGLLPGQNYTVYIKAVSDFFFDGGDIGDLVFQTEFSKPAIKNVTSKNENGGITVQYELLHIGGLDKKYVTIKVVCDTDDLDLESGSTTDENDDNTELSHICNNDCFDDNLTGSLEVSQLPLEAGESYICGISVSNLVGVERQEIQAITLITGYPSIPILNSSVTNNEIEVSMYTEHAGIDRNDSVGEMRFQVVALKAPDMDEVYNKTHSFTGYMNELVKTVSITVSENGSYALFVRAINKYGSSDNAEDEVDIDIPPIPPTQAGTLSPPINIGTVVGAIVGFIVGAVFIVTIVTVVVIFIAVYLKKVKGDKKTRVQPIEEDVVEETKLDTTEL